MNETPDDDSDADHAGHRDDESTPTTKARRPPRRQEGLRADFEAARPFPLDDFQSRALDALDAGHSVLVAAPTGSGKTLVAEYAITRALAAGGKTFYTTPLKALSNQKFGDLVRAHGAARVGLLTGDNSINAAAPIVVMTTEVLRNMIYADSDGCAAALRRARRGPLPAGPSRALGRSHHPPADRDRHRGAVSDGVERGEVRVDADGAAASRDGDRGAAAVDLVPLHGRRPRLTDGAPAADARGRRR